MTRKAGPERREDIIGATVKVLLVKGLGAATTRDVTAELGVGVGLLSHYFTWTELRAVAFERIVRADLDRTLIARSSEPASLVAAELINGAFDLETDKTWRVWIEASDLASGDAELAQSVARCTELWRGSLHNLLLRGHQQRQWDCVDPDGASWRLLALFDGLIGLVITPFSQLAREAATAHLKTAFAHECRHVAHVSN